MSARIIVDADACIGSGECVATAPEAIEIDATGTARMLVDEVDEETALRLVRACPVGALSIAP